MIAFTYVVSGRAARRHRLAVRARHARRAREQTFAWSVIFFFASAAASSAYLTVSETFPLEIRALAIAFFYAVGTGVGGIAGPWLFGALIDTGSRTSVFGGYLLGAALMVAAGVIAAFFAVSRPSASRSKQVARPLASSIRSATAIADGDRSAALDHLAHRRRSRHGRRSSSASRGIVEVADAGVGIDVGRGAAHDALDDLQPRRRSDRDFLVRADRTRARPASPRHRDCRGSAADAPARRRASSSAATEARLMIETTFRGDVGKAVAVGAAAPSAARAARRRMKSAKERLDRGAAFRGAQVAARGLAVFASGSMSVWLVSSKRGAQLGEPGVPHQHQEAGAWANSAGAAGSKPEGPFSMAYIRSPARSGRAVKRVRGQRLRASGPSPDSGRSPGFSRLGWSCGSVASLINEPARRLESVDQNREPSPFRAGSLLLTSWCGGCSFEVRHVRAPQDRARGSDG